MKKIFIFFYLVLVFGIFNCKDSNQLETTPNVSLEKNPVQMDIIDYITNNMRPLLESFDQAMNDFSTVSVAYSWKIQMIRLQSQTIPLKYLKRKLQSFVKNKW